jgi:hypothetical protein
MGQIVTPVTFIAAAVKPSEYAAAAEGIGLKKAVVSGAIIKCVSAGPCKWFLFPIKMKELLTVFILRRMFYERIIYNHIFISFSEKDTVVKFPCVSSAICEDHDTITVRQTVF